MVRLTTLLLSIITVISAGQPVVTKGIKLTFWAKPGANKDPRVLKVEPHDLCSGDIATCQVTRIPNPKTDKALEPHIAIELSTSGRVLHQWAIPIEYVVVGVRGDELLLNPSWNINASQLLAVSTNRRIRLVSNIAPSRGSEFSGFESQPDKKLIDGLAVERFNDSKTKSLRIIAYPEPCT